jgi:YegS/Rv2252/BmrU family lipid kinase
VVANPVSRHGTTGRRWPRLEAQLRDAFGALEVQTTRGPGDAERIAGEAARAGVRRIVVAGGDGTVSQVASGVLAAGLGREVELGVLPLGTGGDLARSLGIPRRVGDAIRCLAEGRAQAMDAGRIEYLDSDDATGVGYFVNIASIGASGEAVALVDRASKRLGGTAAFAIGTVRAILKHRPEPVVVRVDGEVVHEGPLSLAAAANGRRFGGGMLVAPDAKLADGVLDVVVISGLSRAGLIARLPGIYTGGHLRDPAVRAHRGRRVEFRTSGRGLALEADGELLGRTPAVIEVLPGALTLIAPHAPEGAA